MVLAVHPSLPEAATPSARENGVSPEISTTQGALRNRILVQIIPVETFLSQAAAAPQPVPPMEIDWEKFEALR